MFLCGRVIALAKANGKVNLKLSSLRNSKHHRYDHQNDNKHAWEV